MCEAKHSSELIGDGIDRWLAIWLWGYGATLYSHGDVLNCIVEGGEEHE